MGNPLQVEILITRGPEGSYVFPTSTDKKIPSSWSEIPPPPEKIVLSCFMVLNFWWSPFRNSSTIYHLKPTIVMALSKLYPMDPFKFVWKHLIYMIMVIIHIIPDSDRFCAFRGRTSILCLYVLHDRWIHSLMLFHQTVEGRVSSRCRSGVAGRVLLQGNGISIMTSSWG